MDNNRDLGHLRDLLKVPMNERIEEQTTELYEMLENEQFEAQIPREFPHNYLDTNAGVHVALPSSSLTRGFSLATTAIAAFVAGVISQNMYVIAALCGTGRIALEGDVGTITPEKSIVVGLEEILAPGLPDALWLGRDRASAKLVRVVRALLGNPAAQLLQFI